MFKFLLGAACGAGVYHVVMKQRQAAQARAAVPQPPITQPPMSGPAGLRLVKSPEEMN